MGRARSKAAQDYGTTLLGDADVRQILEGRTRQLEAELVGYRMTLAEQEADPHITDPSDDDREVAADGPVHPVVGTSRTIESLEARLGVLRERLAAVSPPESD